MKKSTESQPEISGLRDLSPEQRADVDALCEDGLMPSTIGRRLGIPTEVAAAARLAWKRQAEIEKPTQQQQPQIMSVNPMEQMMAVTQQQMQQTLLQAQIDGMIEQNRHRKESNKLEEREKALELREREAEYREEYAPEPTNDKPSLDEYDFENNPWGAFMKFAKDMKEQSATEPNKAPQSEATLTDEQIAAYVAKQPPQTIGKALAALDTPFHDELCAMLEKNGIKGANQEKVIAWLRAEKKRRAQVKK